MSENVSFGWPISEAARRAGVSPGTVRMWETEGLITPHRSPGGARRFDAAQMRRVERIAYLRNVSKLNTAAIRSLLRAEDARPSASKKSATAGPTYGDQLRRVRRAQKQTLSEVAAATGLSTSFISALERGQVGAGVETIRKLLAHYGTTEHAMLNSATPGSKGTLTRAGNRVQVADAFTRVTTEQLLPVQSTLGGSISTIDPGGGSQGSYAHEGDEFVYILSGRFRVYLEDDAYDLEPGDCLFFASTCPHSWQNVSDEPVVVLWVTTPPSY